MTQNGSCLCGKVKVSVKESDQPLQTAACHCYSCRTTSSSVYGIVSLVSLDDLTIEGKPTKYEDTATKSGTPIERWFCAECGTPVHSKTPHMPGKTFLKMGLFAGKVPIGKPGMEIFQENFEEWEKPIEGAQSSM